MHLYIMISGFTKLWTPAFWPIGSKVATDVGGCIVYYDPVNRGTF